VQAEPTWSTDHNGLTSAHVIMGVVHAEAPEARRRSHAGDANRADQVETAGPHRYNCGMSATEKLAISLPKDLIEKLRRAKDEGRIDSVSGYIADLLRREDDWRDARATLDRIFERCPGPEAKHYAWARQVLGVGAEPAR
jgi:hypothetical protein